MTEQPRCHHTSPTPWGVSQCALSLGHEERHAYSPSETAEDDPEDAVLTGQVRVTPVSGRPEKPEKPVPQKPVSQ